MRYRIWGLIFGGAYTWRGLFSEFYGRIFSLTMSVFCSNTNFCSRMLEMHSKRPRLQNFSRNSLLSCSQITSLLQVFPSPPTPHLIEKPCIPDIDYVSNINLLITISLDERAPHVFSPRMTSNQEF